MVAIAGTRNRDPYLRKQDTSIPPGEAVAAVCTPCNEREFGLRHTRRYAAPVGMYPTVLAFLLYTTNGIRTTWRYGGLLEQLSSCKVFPVNVEHLPHPLQASSDP